MGVSKVVLGDETLIDLTSDSVSSENLLEGATAHGADGEEVIGGVVVTPMYTGTKAAIEAAIAAGQIPEDAIVNITDDEETSSFQTQINQINDSLQNISDLSNMTLIGSITATGSGNGKDISKYKIIYVVFRSMEKYLFDAKEISTNYLSNITRIFMSCYRNSNTSAWADITINKNTIYANEIVVAVGSGAGIIDIYGVK